MTVTLTATHGPHWASTGELADIATVETAALARLRVRVDETIRRRSILVLTGRWGAGKTYSLARATEERAPVHGVEVVWLELKASRGERDLWADLHRQITGTQPARAAKIAELISMVKDALSERPRLVILDEAQEAKKHLFSQVRWLHQQDGCDFGLVFSGPPPLWHNLLPGDLKDRTDHHVRLEGLGDDEAARLLAEYHPIFATADPDDLRRWNRGRARGSFRWWARVLANAVDQLPHLGGTLDETAMASITLDVPDGRP